MHDLKINDTVIAVITVIFSTSLHHVFIHPSCLLSNETKNVFSFNMLLLLPLLLSPPPLPPPPVRPAGLQNPVDALYHLQPLMFLSLFPLYQYNEGKESSLIDPNCLSKLSKSSEFNFCSAPPQKNGALSLPAADRCRRRFASRLIVYSCVYNDKRHLSVETSLSANP